jgi:alpha-beta hydrolase superfamily lysophospholipase
VAQGMMGGAKAHYDGIVAFSQTDFTEDLKKITVPVLVMHGDDDQIVPYADSGPLSAEAPQERDAEDLQGLPPRHAHNGSSDHQRRPLWERATGEVRHDLTAPEGIRGGGIPRFAGPSPA